MKLLNVIDEFTRECPAILIDRRIDAVAEATVERFGPRVLPR